MSVNMNMNGAKPHTILTNWQYISITPTKKLEDTPKNPRIPAYESKTFLTLADHCLSPECDHNCLWIYDLHAHR